jgi:MFS family permease
MYQVEAASAGLIGRTVGTRGKLGVSRNVVLLGLVSLFTDVSAEMVATILPAYVFFALGGSPLAVGAIEGLYQAASAVMRVAGGLAADRSRRYKEVAAVGYGVSAACKLALVAVGNTVGGLGAVLVVDRAGKGIRTAPRDALISLSCSRAGLATAFGVHRALDTAGALLGPLVAFLVLLAAPRMFDAVFVVSFCFAVVGFAILVLFVQNRTDTPPDDDAPPAEDNPSFSFRAAGGLLRQPRFRALVLVGGLLGLVTVGDGLLYLGLQRELGFDTSVFPLLFVGTAGVYMVLAVPIGRLADRWGRKRVFLGGYLMLLCAYATLFLPSAGTGTLAAALVALGVYYAASDGVLMAIASCELPESLRGSGMGFVVTAVGVARFAAALAFGAVWTLADLETAALAFACALAAAIVLAALWLPATADPARG